MWHLDFENRLFSRGRGTYSLFTKSVPNALVEILTVRIGRQKVPVLMNWEIEVAVNRAAIELQVKQLFLLEVSNGSEDSRL